MFKAKNTDVAIATVGIFNDKYGLTNQNICGNFGINWYLIVVNNINGVSRCWQNQCILNYEKSNPSCLYDILSVDR